MQNGRIDFPEFLELFRDELLDLRTILEYLEMNLLKQVGGLFPLPLHLPCWQDRFPRRLPRQHMDRDLCVLQAPPAEAGKLGHILADLGCVTLFFSQAELDALLERNADRLVVVEASLTWCRPCKGFEKTFQVP